MERSVSTRPLVPEVHTLDPRRVERLRRLGELLDNSIPVPGTDFRFGIDAIIGLVPGVGDLIGGALSAYIILEAARLGVPRALLTQNGLQRAGGRRRRDHPGPGRSVRRGLQGESAELRAAPRPRRGARDGAPGRPAIRPPALAAGSSCSSRRRQRPASSWSISSAGRSCEHAGILRRSSTASRSS